MFQQYDNQDGDDGRTVVPESVRDRRRLVLFGVVTAVVFAALLILSWLLAPR
jgi:hypothetical protein